MEVKAYSTFWQKKIGQYFPHFTVGKEFLID